MYLFIKSTFFSEIVNNSIFNFLHNLFSSFDLSFWYFLLILLLLNSMSTIMNTRFLKYNIFYFPWILLSYLIKYYDVILIFSYESFHVVLEVVSFSIMLIILCLIIYVMELLKLARFLVALVLIFKQVCFIIISL